MSKSYETMGQSPSKPSGDYRYTALETGEQFVTKPEHMTQLRGNVLVNKTHPRIDFRGKLDYLQAEVLVLASQTQTAGQHLLSDQLNEILELCRRVMTAEALESPLEDKNLFGFSEKELQDQSHNPKKYFGVDHPYPNREMDLFALRLNTLRTQVRQVELAGVLAHIDQKEPWQHQILRALNRLSSAVYVLYCHQVAQDQ